MKDDNLLYELNWMKSALEGLMSKEDYYTPEGSERIKSLQYQVDITQKRIDDIYLEIQLERQSKIDSILK